MAQSTLRFHAAARWVKRRLTVARYARRLAASGPWVFGSAAAVLVLVRLLAGPGGGGLSGAVGAGCAAVVIAGWLIGPAVALWRRPIGERQAVAAWGERIGDHEALLSAWAYERLDAPTPGQQLHLQRAAALLDEHLPRLKSAVPVRVGYDAVVPPLAVLALAWSALFIPPPPPAEPPLDRFALDRAAQVSHHLDDHQQMLDRLAGLDPQDREQLEELDEQIKRTAEHMRSLKDASASDVLRELEALARAAEALRAAMGDGDGEPLSQAMIEELEKHADTADFGAALRSENHERAAEESKRISENLDPANRTREQARRLARAVDRAMDVASDQDRAGMVGRQLDAADADFKADDPDAAGERFAELAEQLRKRGEREQARRRLDELAAELRESGQHVVNRQAGATRQLAQARPGNTRSLGGEPMPMPGQRQGEDTTGGASADPQNTLNRRMPLPVPGEQGGDEDHPPVPGTASARRAAGPPPESSAAGRFAERSDRPAAEGPPVPGAGGRPQDAGEGAGEGAGMAEGAGAGEGEGVGSAMQLAAGGGVGGNEAGSGTAGLGEGEPGERIDAAGASAVAVSPSGQGPSATREIQGREQRGAAGGDPRQLALEQLRAQEEALADEPLPLSRRQQVRRYFTLLRSELESTP